MKKVLFAAVLLVMAAAGYTEEFGFTLGGESSEAVLIRSEKTVSQKAAEEGVAETRTVWFDPKTEIKVERVAHRYDDFPALDYTIYITNTGSGKSPVLADFRAYDGVLLRSKGNVKLHWDRGGINSPRAFEPMVDILGDSDKTVVRDAPAPEVACDDTLYGAAHYNPFMGKGSDRVSSYFNFEGKGGGVIFCVGWPGQWSMDVRKEGKKVAVTAGQAELEGALNPGETVRSPRMLIMPYKGDFVDGQNLWRRFYFAHATPKINGKPPKARLNMSICEIHRPATLDYVKRLTDYGVKAEYVWQDASWYKCSPDPKHKQPMDWVITGNWETVSDDLRDSFAYCRKLGMKTMLWFEPERVYKGTDFCNNHPDWVISGDFPESWGGGDYGNLVDFSNPAAVNWFINRFDKLIKETGTDMYREDFNMSPLRYWQRVDDRKGFVENHHIQGHLRLWQTLKDRNPGLEIDSCASGGLRNDYETMCAALPVLRTDYEGVPDPEGHQASFFGSAYWLPLAGIGMRGADVYDFRSTYGGIATAVWIRDINVRTGKPYDIDLMRRLDDEYLSIKDCYTGDYYPLTLWNIDKDKWIAAQFDLPREGRGIIQAFRRPENKDVSITVKLRGLESGADYELTDADSGKSEVITGKALAAGYTLSAKEPGTSIIIRYVKK